jgi:dolichol kinase
MWLELPDMPDDSNPSATTEVGHDDPAADENETSGSASNLSSSRRVATDPPRPQHSEFYRKLLHMSPGLLPFALGFVPHPDPLDWVSQAVVIFFCVTGAILFLSLRGTVQRAGEDNLLSTVISYPAIVVLTVLLFPAHVELTGVVVVILALGDGAAYIGGKTFGKTKLPWNTQKSWVGTMSFVAVAGPIATLAYMLLADADGRRWPIAAACGFAAAICGAIAESLPVKLTDNLRVGVAALVAVTLMQGVLVGLQWF